MSRAALDTAAIERQVRLVSIILYSEEAGLNPVSLDAVHALAYLADALAPVWGLPIIDKAVLKDRRQPFFPALQRDLDQLVGMGMVDVVSFSHLPVDGAGRYRLSADYRLVRAHSEPVIQAIRGLPRQARKLSFVREVVYAASGLGRAGLGQIGLLDATYSDPMVDFGSVIDMEGDDPATVSTADVARRFAQLTSNGRYLGDSEMVHLYVRHLYRRLSVA